jgi:hypothetical protein
MAKIDAIARTMVTLLRGLPTPEMIMGCKDQKNNENTLTKILVIGIFLSTCFSTQESGASRGIFMCVSIFERKSLKGVALPA